jgi:hypothetical protein
LRKKGTACFESLGVSGIVLIIPNSAVESEVVSEEQTFRSEDNAFLPLSSGQLSLLFITTLTKEATCQAPKNFEAARLGVFATPGLPLAHFNCGIRDHFKSPSVRRRMIEEVFSSVLELKEELSTRREFEPNQAD